MMEGYGAVSSMLPLDNPRWNRLQHAYGTADDIPALLRQLEDFPPDEAEAEPWFTIWSALAHQGDVYDGSFAAVPHVVAIACASPEAASLSFLNFPAWVEICRAKKDLAVPADLAPAYHAALARIPGLIAAMSDRAWDEDWVAIALAALAAAKGQPEIAEAALELSKETAPRIMKWVFSQ